MTTEPNEAVVWRAERARESIEEARLLAETGHWNTCVNRLYYGCFYAVSALLLQDGLSSTRHTGVRALFNKECVRPGKVTKELASVYNDLFERRQESDYEDLFSFSEDDVRPWIEQASSFVQEITLRMKT